MSHPGGSVHPWPGPLLPQMPRKLPAGNLLTRPGSPTIVLEEYSMNSSPHGPGTIVALGRYRWVCLVVASLLLFNPFMATPRSGHGLGTPASHRATVGASELEHFSPTDGWGYLPAPHWVEASIVLPLRDLTAQFFHVLPSVPSFSPPFYGPGLWFRPPPAR